MGSPVVAIVDDISLTPSLLDDVHPVGRGQPLRLQRLGSTGARSPVWFYESVHDNRKSGWPSQLPVAAPQARADGGIHRL